MTHVIEKVEDAKAFIFAGNATVTLRSTVSGKRFTYRIRQNTDDDGKKSPFFVSVLSGTNNENDYQYIGFIPLNKSLKLLAGKKGKKDALSYKAFEWAINRIVAHQMPSNLEVWHEGRCGACNRKLTVPESILTGFGPECNKRRMGV